MSSPIESPFAVRPEQAPPASATAIASFSYSYYRKAMISQINKIGGHLSGLQTSVEGLEEEDLAFDEEGAYDEDFDASTQLALTDVINDCQQTAILVANLADRAAKFRLLMQARIDAPPEA